MQTGIKNDSGKPRWSLLPMGSIEKVIRVLEYGADKYEVDNWKRVPDAKQRYLDAAFRHLAAIASGEWIDAESGHSHAAHACCCCLFLIYNGNKV